MTVGLHIGRRRRIMIGLQSAKDVPATVFYPLVFDENELGDQITTLNKNGGFGRREGSLGTETNTQFSETQLNGKTGSETMGLLLLGAMGDYSFNVDDPEAGANTHDILVQQSQNPRYFTIAEERPDDAGGIQKRRVLNAALKTLVLNFVQQEFVSFQANFVGKYPEAGTETFVTAEEPNFVFGTARLKFAANVAGLGAAPAKSMQSYSITIENNTINDFGSGSEPVKAIKQTFNVAGEFEKFLEDDEAFNQINTNLIQAIEIKLTHPTNIPTTSVPLSIKFTFPKIQLSSRGEGGGLDDLRTETFTFEDAAYDIATTRNMAVQVVNGEGDYTV